MTWNYLSAVWSTISSLLGNHLWQSTLFACVVAAVMMVLRENRARVRFWLWFVASMKFLIPFSLLAAIGSHFAWRQEIAEAGSGWYSIIDQFSRPFVSRTPLISQGPAASSSFSRALPGLLVVWFCGFLVAILIWLVRWWRISAAIQNAVPVAEGREAEALRRAKRIERTQKRIKLLLSRAPLEPGIFGVFRPVLLWPQGVSERLEDEHLDAILTHELAHVRHYDNLVATLHMMVEAIFWFHPVVWWLGFRLMEERERACDERVLELGSKQHVYAESILRICKFCVNSPLDCVSAVTGADLKRRMVRIMSDHVVKKLDFQRKLLLAVAGLAVFAVPVGFGLLNARQTRADSPAESTTTQSFVYQTVSIKLDEAGMAAVKANEVIRQRMLAKPGGFDATNTPVRQLIQAAYNMQDDRVMGGPDWITSELYDIDAQSDEATTQKIQAFAADQQDFVHRRQLQTLLADRFKLIVHRETKELPVYTLLLAEGGPKLQEATPGNTYSNGVKGPNGLPVGPGQIVGGLSPLNEPTILVAQAVPMTSVAQKLSWQLDHTVFDMTGLKGNYDFTLRWMPDARLAKRGSDSPAPLPSDLSIAKAIEQQLGLKLELQKAPIQVLVIDHIETPTTN